MKICKLFSQITYIVLMCLAYSKPSSSCGNYNVRKSDIHCVHMYSTSQEMLSK